MSHSTLDFSSAIRGEEKNYITISLEDVKETILCRLDIVQVAMKLWLNPHKICDGKRKQEDYFGSADIYEWDCNRCGEKWKLRIFYWNQTFWCKNCHWEWESASHLNIFALLNHWDKSDDRFDYGYESDKRQIQQLFDLFPLELAELKWHNLNRHIYKDNFFSEAEKYSPEMEKKIKINEERIWRLRSNVHELQKVWTYYNEELNQQLSQLERETSTLYCITKAYAVISDIYARREAIYNIIHEKSISEVIWYEINDEYADINTELASLSETLREIIWIDEFSIQLLQEEKDEEEAEKQRIQDEENAKIEADRIAEELRIQELARARIENPRILLNETISYNNEKSVFFESCEYFILMEWEKLLTEWDFGKFVVVFHSDNKTFSVIFGKNKVESAPPNSYEDAEHKTNTRNMPFGAWQHSAISIPDWSNRLWGAQYIILPNNNILIGWNSWNYWDICCEIVEKCLVQWGYKVHFLNNTTYLSLWYIYKKVLNK